MWVLVFMLSSEVFSNITIVSSGILAVIYWLPGYHPISSFFLAIAVPGSLSCSPYYLYLNSWWSQYMYIWRFHSMAAHNLNVFSPHDLAVQATSASSLPKSNCRPCQDCYLQPSHHTIPLWSSSFIFSVHFLYPHNWFQWSLTLHLQSIDHSILSLFLMVQYILFLPIQLKTPRSMFVVTCTNQISWPSLSSSYLQAKLQPWLNLILLYSIPTSQLEVPRGKHSTVLTEITLKYWPRTSSGSFMLQIIVLYLPSYHEQCVVNASSKRCICTMYKKQDEYLKLESSEKIMNIANGWICSIMRRKASERTEIRSCHW